MKHCNGCNTDLPIDSFHKKGKAGIHSKCKTCLNAISREKGRAKATYNPTVRRRYLLKKNYGLTIDSYEKMLFQQNGVCAICSTDSPGGNGSFYVDHSHITGAVRGLLCHHCNFLLGHAKDNTDILWNAAVYLLKTEDVLF